MYKSITGTEIIQHKGVSRIKISFAYNAETASYIKQFGGRWSKSLKSWHIADTPENRKLFLKDTVKQEIAAHFNLPKFKMWLQANRYSENTIKSYMDGMKVFAQNMSPELHPEEITNEHVTEFMQEYAYRNDLSVSWQRLIINVLKLYFAIIEEKKLELDKIVRPHKDKLLPNVLSKEEIENILKETVNVKHRCMLSLIYSCGLRRSELLKMKPEHIQSNRGLILIKAAKGRKDRMVPLSEKTLELLRTYYKKYRPSIWLFEGQDKGEPYHERSLSEVLHQATKRAGIKKPVTLHWLRHSYATHLLEAGVDIRYIQELLGHNSSKTTEIYTHVSRKAITAIKSPFDDLNI